jgi:hypothetical protein
MTGDIGENPGRRVTVREAAALPAGVKDVMVGLAGDRYDGCAP